MYQGEFYANAMHGRGKLTEKDGAVYSGQFKQGKLHDARSRIVYANGDTYEGDVEEGVLCGEGVLCFTNGDRYEGEFKNNSRWGSGVMHFATGDQYEGRWNDAQMHGHGIMTYEGNASYEGSFKNNLKHGRGMWVATFILSFFLGKYELCSLVCNRCKSYIKLCLPPKLEVFDPNTAGFCTEDSL